MPRRVRLLSETPTLAEWVLFTCLVGVVVVAGLGLVAHLV